MLRRIYRVRLRCLDSGLEQGGLCAFDNMHLNIVAICCGQQCDWGRLALYHNKSEVYDSLLYM